MRLKTCIRCRKDKDSLLDYYANQGHMRAECKACTSRLNTQRQKRQKVWINRFVDEESRKEYAKEYYAKNKERFASYRSAFKKKNPEYHKMYQRNRKNEKRSGE